jgi:hypothetical protein
MHLKVFLKLKNHKNSLFLGNIYKKPNKSKKKQKAQKNRLFSNPALMGVV